MKNRMELCMPSLPENEAFARMVISAFLLKADPSMSVVSEVRTAVSEAVTDAVVHAYDSGEEGRIVMRAELSEKVLNIHIEDYGRGIDNIHQAMQPFFTTSSECERTGMGFSLMLSFMDGVKVYSVPGSGTTVEMTKLLYQDDEDAI